MYTVLKVVGADFEAFNEWQLASLSSKKFAAIMKNMIKVTI